MRTPRPAGLDVASASPGQELAIPRSRRPVPTHTRPRTRRVPVAMYVVALLLLPGLLVAGFMSAGWWATTGTAATAQAGTPSAEGGTEAAPPATPAEIKGSMTVQQVINAFPAVTAAEVMAKLGAPLDTPTSTQLKTLVESGDGLDIPALRTWLQEQKAR